MKTTLKHLAKKTIRSLKKPSVMPKEPLSTDGGLERGTPLRRHFVDAFMEKHSEDIRGVVLAIQNRHYADSLGQGVERADVLDLDASSAHAGFVTDLASADGMPSNSYDCFIINETLQFVFDLDGALAHAHRILRPGGVLLATMPCTAQHDPEASAVDLWRFTERSCRRLFGDVFGHERVEVETYGNYLTCLAGLAGVVTEEIAPELREERSRMFIQGVCVRACKQD
ncbi:MAG: methyltransferase domain-containing protein [Verrucomicrobiales bacterium]